MADKEKLFTLVDFRLARSGKQFEGAIGSIDELENPQLKWTDLWIRTKSGWNVWRVQENMIGMYREKGTITETALKETI